MSPNHFTNACRSYVPFNNDFSNVLTNIIDGSGFAAGQNPAGSTLDSAVAAAIGHRTGFTDVNTTDGFFSTVATSGAGNFDFTFNAPVDIDSLLIWNYSQAHPTANFSDRGIATFNILADTGSGFTAVGGLRSINEASDGAPGANSATHTAQEIAGLGLTGVTALRFDVVTNHGGNVTGLDEVVFGVNAVPEPGSLAMLAIGGVGLVARRRRK